MKTPNIAVSVPSDLGAQKMGTSIAYEALFIADLERGNNIIKNLPKHTVSYPKMERGNVGPFANGKYAEILSGLNQNTALEIQSILSNNNYPLVISGDHSNAIGIMAGIRDHIGKDKKLGVIWVDAHADLHTPYTTPSGNFHGMSLSASMGFDNLSLSRNDVDAGLQDYWEQIKKCGTKQIVPKIHPEDIYFLGLRDFEIQEYHLIRDFHLKHSSPYDIKAKGMQAILEEIVGYFSTYDAVYVSFDVDVLDTSISTGTGTPVYNGLQMNEAKQVVNTLKMLPNIALWEFTEINPLLDNNNSMCKAVLKLLDVLFDNEGKQ